MFLTTNRIEEFDPAFKSRIHFSLKYNQLSESSRKALWHEFLLLGSPENSHYDDKLLDELATHDLNGRQIRNMVRTACAIARSKGSDLTAQHLRTAIRAMVTFENETDTSGSDRSHANEELDLNSNRKRPRLS
jgi:hypothetical protein